MKALLEEGLRLLEIPFTSSQVDDCLVYLAELTRWNTVMNLVGDEDEKLLSRHLLDSLAALPHLAPLPVRRAADAGSGGGFPGIPLAVFLSETDMTLIERSAKKAVFLRNASALLSCRTHLRVLQENLERVDASFDLVVTRALTDIGKGLKLLWPLTAPGGTLVFYKGTARRTEEEIAAAGKLPVPPRIIPLKVPSLSGERHLVLFSRSQ